MSFDEFEKKIGYVFKNKNLLETALTHSSYAYEKKKTSNEKLEYLGDSILEFISSIYIYENFYHLTEGEMTKVRATVVCENSLYKIANLLGFSDFLLLGKSEKFSEQKGIRPAILADSVEAVIAAIYLDGGIEPVKNFIINNLKEDIIIASENVGQKDYKTVLQEKLQAHGEVHIEYNIINEYGPDHEKTFVAEVICNGKILASGKGNSKKHAEMSAAKNALDI